MNTLHYPSYKNQLLYDNIVEFEMLDIYMYSDNGFHQNDLSKEFEDKRTCIIQRCYTPAEYQCTSCMKRYCDEHFRIHAHLDKGGSDDLK